jgi:hypothetical protein
MGKLEGEGTVLYVSAHVLLPMVEFGYVRYLALPYSVGEPLHRTHLPSLDDGTARSQKYLGRLKWPLATSGRYLTLSGPQRPLVWPSTVLLWYSVK